MDTILERVNTVESQISRVKNKQAYRDLRHMLSSIDRIVTEISKESVMCRQTKRVTPRYTELVTECNNMIDNLEKHIMLAILMHG